MVQSHAVHIRFTQSHYKSKQYFLDLTAQTGDAGYITLLRELKFNEDILYQDYNSKFPDQGGNEKLGNWYGRAPEFGDKMCSWILTDEANELIVRSNISDIPNIQKYQILHQS